jgi:hypothetical protein
MNRAYICHRVEKKERTTKDVLDELEEITDNILVSYHVAMIKSGQLDYSQGMISLVHSLTEYTKVLEDRINFILVEPGATA